MHALKKINILNLLQVASDKIVCQIHMQIQLCMITLTHFLRHAAWLEWHPTGQLLTPKHVNAIYPSDVD